MESRKTHTSDENLANHRKLLGLKIRAKQLNAHMAPKNHQPEPAPLFFFSFSDFQQGLWMEKDEKARHQGLLA